jgi:radical SAM protein with 4Fe4S-binding SPASM domain
MSFANEVNPDFTNEENLKDVSKLSGTNEIELSDEQETDYNDISEEVIGKLAEIDFHITDDCNGHCPMCYATKEGTCRSYGDLETLKKIVHNAIVNGEVERFVMVGGDPCKHPHLVELLKYIKEEGEKYKVKTNTIVLSNTHDYQENGVKVDIKDVAPYIDEMSVTVHGPDAASHDAFNGVEGSYEHVMRNLKEFARVKNDDQSISVTINVMPHTVENMSQIMINSAIELGQNFSGKKNLDYFLIQRIAPSGRAKENPTEYFIEKYQVNEIMKTFKTIKDKYGFGIEFCDVFPWCSVAPEYRDMLPKGGCNWGNEVLAVFQDGSIKRCAMANDKLSKNMLELDSPEKFNEFWKNDPKIVAFRKKKHLDERCLACKMLNDCGGSCVMSRCSGDPYKGAGKPKRGYDYLANRCNPDCGDACAQFRPDPGDERVG